MNLSPIIIQIKAEAEQYFATVQKIGDEVKKQVAQTSSYMNSLSSNVKKAYTETFQLLSKGAAYATAEFRKNISYTKQAYADLWATMKTGSAYAFQQFSKDLQLFRISASVAGRIFRQSIVSSGLSSLKMLGTALAKTGVHYTAIMPILRSLATNLRSQKTLFGAMGSVARINLALIKASLAPVITALSTMGSVIRTSVISAWNMLKQAVAATAHQVSQFVRSTIVGMQTAIASVRTFGNHWILAGKNIRSAGKMMSVYISTPLALLGAASVKAFAQFDESLTKTKAFLGPKEGTQKNMAVLENAAMANATSGESPFGATETMDAFKLMSQSGMGVAQSLETVGIMSQFATAAEMNMEDATQALLTSLYSFKAASDDPLIMANNLVRMSDVVVAAASSSTASVGEIARSMASDSAAAAHQYGMSIEGLGAALATFADAGKKAENAGHTVGRALRLMTGTFMKNKEVWQKYGIDLIDKSTGQFVDFGQAIGMIEDKLGSLTGPGGVALLEALGIEQLSQKSITPLLGLSKKMRELEEQFKKTGTTAEMAKTMMGSFSNQLRMFKNAVEVAAISVGRMLAPYVIFAMAKIREGMAWVASWSDQNKKLAMNIALVVAALGPILVGISVFVSLVGYLITGIATFMGFIGSILTAMASLGGVVVWVTATFLLIIPLITFFGMIIKRSIDWMGGIEQAAMTIWGTLLAFWAWVSPMWNSFMSLVMVVASDLADTFIWAVTRIVNWVSWATTSILNYFGMTWNDVSELTAELFKMMEFTWLNMELVWQLAMLNMRLYATQFVDQVIFMFYGQMAGAVSNAFEEMETGMLNFGDMSWTVFNNLIKNIISMMKSLPGLIAGTTNLADIWTPLTEGFVARVPELKDISKRQISDTEKALTAEVAAQQEKVAGAYNKFKNKAAENAVPEAKKLVDAAKPVWGEMKKDAAHGSEEFVEELEDKKKKVEKAFDLKDSALKGSSEAAKRIAEFMDGIPDIKDAERKAEEATSGMAGDAISAYSGLAASGVADMFDAASSVTGTGKKSAGFFSVPDDVMDVMEPGVKAASTAADMAELFSPQELFNMDMMAPVESMPTEVPDLMDMLEFHPEFLDSIIPKEQSLEDAEMEFWKGGMLPPLDESSTSTTDPKQSQFQEMVVLLRGILENTSATANEDPITSVLQPAGIA